MLSTLQGIDSFEIAYSRSQYQGGESRVGTKVIEKEKAATWPDVVYFELTVAKDQANSLFT
jgi:hypothetical protein